MLAYLLHLTPLHRDDKKTERGEEREGVSGSWQKRKYFLCWSSRVNLLSVPGTKCQMKWKQGISHNVN